MSSTTSEHEIEDDVIDECSKGVMEQIEFGEMCICFHYKEDHDEKTKECNVRSCSCRLFKPREED